MRRFSSVRNRLRSFTLIVACSLLVSCGSPEASQKPLDRQQPDDHPAAIEAAASPEVAASVTFAVHAVAHADLLDPLGDYYHYTDVNPLGENSWRVGFDALVCKRTVVLETCEPNPIGSSAFLDVEMGEPSPKVVAAEGPHSEQQERRLLQFREPGQSGEGRFHFASSMIVPPMPDGPSEVAGPSFRGVIFWAGPLASSPDRISCRPVITNGRGEVVYKGQAHSLVAPTAESKRMGGIASERFPRGVGAERAALRCDGSGAGAQQWQPFGEVSLEPVVLDGRNYVYVRSAATWEGEATEGAQDLCLGRVFDSDGDLVGREYSWMPGPEPTGEPSYRGEVVVRVEVPGQDASAGSVVCGQPPGRDE